MKTNRGKSRPSRRCGVFLAMTGVLFASSGALGAPPTDADRAYADGVAAFKGHDYEGARAAFQKSLELAPRTSTVLNVALAEFYSGHALEALKHFRLYLAAPDAAPERADEVRATMIPRAEAQIGRLQIEAPAGATVLVDDVRVGVAPLPSPVEVMPGSHVITVTIASGRPSSITLRAVAGEIARARIVGNESAAIATNEGPAASTAPASASASETESGAVPGWSTPKKVTVIALGAGALVSFGVGITFGLRSNSDKNSADMLRQGESSSTCAPPAGQPLPALCGQLQSALNSQSTDGKIADGFVIGGAALAVGAVASWLLWPSAKASETHAWVRPMFGRSTGVEFGTSF